MQVIIGKEALGFGYIADPKSKFILVENAQGEGSSRQSFAVEIRIDASLKYPTFAPGESWEIEIPRNVTGQNPKNPRKKRTFKLPVWYEEEKFQGGGRRLRMLLECGRDTQILSLAELSARLRCKPESADSQQDHSDFDEIFQKLLAVASRMHRDRQTIGLVDPANIFYYRRKSFEQEESPANRSSEGKTSLGSIDSSAVQLLLPDLLFAPFGGMPRWVQLREEYDFLWNPEYPSVAEIAEDEGEISQIDRRAHARMRYLDEQLDCKSFDPRKDLRALARLMAWSLTGKKITGPISDRKLTSGTWDHFRDVFDPETSVDAATFATIIRSTGNEPSSHFLERVQAPKPNAKRNWNLLIAGSVVLLFLAATLSQYFLPRVPPSPERYEFCPNCDSRSPLHKLFRDEQGPLITEFRQHYPDSKNGDNPIASIQVVSGDRIKLDKLRADVLASQTENLIKQIDIVKRGFYIAGNQPEADALECLQSEFERLQFAVKEHFSILQNLQMEFPQVRRAQLIKRFADLIESMDSFSIEHQNLGANEKALNTRNRSDLEKKWGEIGGGTLTDKDVRMASTFKDVEDGIDFLKLVKTIRSN